MKTLLKYKSPLIGAAGLIVSLNTMPAFASDSQCEVVRFSDVGWTDITATTAITSEVLKGLGYETSTQLLSVPVTYSSMANKDIDVFLGNWMPTMEGDIANYHEAGTVETVRANLQGAKYTLAVPQYVFDAGVRSFADLVKFKSKFRGRIYGIEAGNDGNRLIQSMIDDNAFDLEKFRLVESSEAGMVSQVKRAIDRQQWVVFLGWAPHPMNNNFDIAYLDGGDDYFGPNYGGASIYTNVRKNYLETCPNIGQLLKNLSFSLPMENELMNAILNENAKPSDAANNWLKENPEVLDKWLKQVSARNGSNAQISLRHYLQI